MTRYERERLRSGLADFPPGSFAVLVEDARALLAALDTAEREAGEQRERADEYRRELESAHERAQATEPNRKDMQAHATDLAQRLAAAERERDEARAETKRLRDGLGRLHDEAPACPGDGPDCRCQRCRICEALGRRGAVDMARERLDERTRAYEEGRREAMEEAARWVRGLGDTVEEGEELAAAVRSLGESAPTPSDGLCQHALKREAQQCRHGFHFGTTCERCAAECPKCRAMYPDGEALARSLGEPEAAEPVQSSAARESALAVAATLRNAIAIGFSLEGWRSLAECSAEELELSFNKDGPPPPCSRVDAVDTSAGHVDEAPENKHVGEVVIKNNDTVDQGAVEPGEE